MERQMSNTFNILKEMTEDVLKQNRPDYHHILEDVRNLSEQKPKAIIPEPMAVPTDPRIVGGPNQPSAGERLRSGLERMRSGTINNPDGSVNKFATKYARQSAEELGDLTYGSKYSEMGNLGNELAAQAPQQMRNTLALARTIEDSTPRKHKDKLKGEAGKIIPGVEVSVDQLAKAHQAYEDALTPGKIRGTTQGQRVGNFVATSRDIGDIVGVTNKGEAESRLGIDPSDAAEEGRRAGKQLGLELLALDRDSQGNPTEVGSQANQLAAPQRKEYLDKYSDKITDQIRNSGLLDATLGSADVDTLNARADELGIPMRKRNKISTQVRKDFYEPTVDTLRNFDTQARERAFGRAREVSQQRQAGLLPAMPGSRAAVPSELARNKR